jgi:hypothetical protein
MEPARRATTETAANETPTIKVSHTGLLRGARTGTQSATAEWRARSLGARLWGELPEHDAASERAWGEPPEHDAASERAWA